MTPETFAALPQTIKSACSVVVLAEVSFDKSAARKARAILRKALKAHDKASDARALDSIVSAAIQAGRLGLS